MNHRNNKGFKRIRVSNYITVFVLLATLWSCSGSDSDNSPSTDNVTSYDSTLAQKLQADQYGMHQYVIAFLKKGPNRDMDSAKAMELQRAHMANIGRMADAGTLVLAGPFLDTGQLRGIYIFDVKTVEEAKALTNSDPAIQAGSLVMELKPWYGSAALMQVNEIHGRISKESP